MKFSTKFLLLLATLIIVLIAYTRHRYDYLSSQRVNQANADGFDGYVGIGFTAMDESEIIEADKQRSLFYYGARGELVAVTLGGPEGRRRLSELSVDLDAIENLTFASHDVIDAFVPSELPRIKRLVLKNLDWDEVNLTSLGDLRCLDKLYLDTAANDPVKVLSTIPADAAIERIEVIAYLPLDLSSIDFPSRLRTLTVSCPNLNADAVRRLQLQCPECTVVGYDNAKMKVVPGG